MATIATNPMPEISAYLDESWSQEHGIYVVAGYVGLESEFRTTLEPMWITALENAPRPFESFREFKAADLSHGKSNFAGWDRDDECMPFYRKMTEALSGALSQTSIEGVAAAIVFPEGLPDIEHCQSGHDGAFNFVLRDLLTRVAPSYHKSSGAPRSTLVVTCDERREPRFRNLVNRRFSHSINHIDTQGFAPPGLAMKQGDKRPALQAADLLSYETYLEVRSRKTNACREVRKSLQVLTEGGAHFATCIDVTFLGLYNLAGVDPMRAPAHILFRSGEPLRAKHHWMPGYNSDSAVLEDALCAAILNRFFSSS